jgi:uncharacterized protein
MYASKNGDLELVKLLIENGVDVNQTDENDYSALHKMKIYKFPDIAKLLINNGANVNNVSTFGKSILIDAVIGLGCSSELELLIERGADVHFVDKKGKTALAYE